MTRLSRIPTEHQEQVALVKWAAMHPHPALRNLFAIPNGGARNIVVARKLKAEGVQAGVPDLFLAWPVRAPMPSHPHLSTIVVAGVFIEMKRREGGSVSPAQREWRERLTAAGYVVWTCKGWDEAREAIETYLRWGK